ncbi:MAG: Fic family protein [Oligoflexus sp.]|nr:Fic family protein [Oligoflexus sp.]
MPKAMPIHLKLSEALDAAKKASGGSYVFRGADLKRSHMETLRGSGWIQLLHSGWYALVNPSKAMPGESLSYSTNYWEFVSKYLEEHYGEEYILAPKSSLALHTADLSLPAELLVQTPRNIYSTVNLPFNTSLFISRDKNFKKDRSIELMGIRVYALEAAIANMGPPFFREGSPLLEASLHAIKDPYEVSRFLVEDSSQTTAGRITACLKLIGRQREAGIIEKAIAAAGLQLKSEGDVETNFASRDLPRPSIIGARVASMWRGYSKEMAEAEELGEDLHVGSKKLFYDRPFSEIEAKINESYESDAYNSLSIEGYQVTEELIAKIKSGELDLTDPTTGQKDKNALAARGYFEAFQLVLETIRKIHQGADAGDTICTDLVDWRMALFTPAVRAGSLPASSIAGFRQDAVYIRDSRHVPMQKDKILDAMECMEYLLKKEEAFRRAVLGHHMLVHIHPFSDGNGRTARFLMNACLVTAGLPWTVIKLDKKREYFAALETAHSGGTILPFARFISNQIQSQKTLV